MKNLLVPTVCLLLVTPLVVLSQDIKVHQPDNATQPSDSRNARNATEQPEPWPERPLHVERTKQTHTPIEVRFDFANSDPARKVKEVTWECTLIHPDTKVEISKYVIVSRKKVLPKEVAILKKRVLVPLKPFQPRVVDATEAGKKDDELAKLAQAIQHNRIIEIKYADGSVEHP